MTEPGIRGTGDVSRSRLRIGTNLTIVAFGIFILVEALKMPVGTPENPEAGFWPVMISGIFLFLAVLLLVTERDNDDYAVVGRSSVIVAAAIASLALFVVLFSIFGFIVPGFILMVFWLRWLGHESWRATIVTSILLVAGFYILFVRILDVPFPEEILAHLGGG